VTATWPPVEDAWADPTPTEGPPANVYANVGDWVTRWLSPTYARHITQNQVWCPYWFRHAEAVSRLEGAWRAWEQLSRPQQWGGDEWFGASIWWTQHGDPCMDRLLSLNGPFRNCIDGKHSDDLAPLPVAPVPARLFDP
jgi:hypothetical protein